MTIWGDLLDDILGRMEQEMLLYEFYKLYKGKTKINVNSSHIKNLSNPLLWNHLGKKTKKK